MNILSKLSLVTLIIVSSCASCTKHSDSRTTATHFFSATGGPLGSFSALATQVSSGGAAGSKLEIDAKSSTGATMILYLNPYTGVPGTFALTDSNSGAEYMSTPSATPIVSVYGTVTLTSVTPDIIGTFSYTANDLSVVSGSFNAVAP